MALVVRGTYFDIMRGSEWFGRCKGLMQNASDTQQQKGSGRLQTHQLGDADVEFLTCRITVNDFEDWTLTFDVFGVPLRH
jgi:hypothetical protein